MSAKVLVTSRARKFKTGPSHFLGRKLKKSQRARAAPLSFPLFGGVQGPRSAKCDGARTSQSPAPLSGGVQGQATPASTRAGQSQPSASARAPGQFLGDRGKVSRMTTASGSLPPPPQKKTPPTLGLHAHIIGLGFTPYHTRVIGLHRLT